MAKYDFLVLQPDEFEEFSRDVLQRHLGFFIESFTSGPDGGIDLRYAVAADSKMNDLNNLVGLYPEIEKKHYKLWLSSVNVLQTILHTEAVNWSEFELEDIKSRIAVYVQNPSFDKARDIINDHSYVIISGIPGIGKTTLARMLAYDLLANGYEQFVAVAGSLDNAMKLYCKDKKQVFSFDDFLGANVFEPDGSGFDRRLETFINAIKRDGDKYATISPELSLTHRRLSV